MLFRGISNEISDGFQSSFIRIYSEHNSPIYSDSNCSCRKKERRKKNNLPVLQVPGVVLSQRFFATRGVLLVMKTLEDERYVVIKAYKCTVSEIWRDSFVLAYIACTSYPYIQSLPTL